ncbi:MAG: hypothetical protein WCT54_01640 [Patescibacteria group bacterium]
MFDRHMPTNPATPCVASAAASTYATTAPPSTSTEPSDSSECSDHFICRCDDEGMPCFEVVSGRGIPQTTTQFVCSHGLFLTKTEKTVYGNFLYRNECLPAGRAPLKSCKLGEDCSWYGLREREPCMAENEKLGICTCSLIFDFSTPKMRIVAESVRCMTTDENESPPTDPCNPDPSSDDGPTHL